MAKNKNGFQILGANDKLNFGGKKPYKRDEKIEKGDLYGGDIKPLKGVDIKPKNHPGREFDVEQANYNIKNSMYVNHAIQMEEAKRTGRFKGPTIKTQEVFNDTSRRALNHQPQQIQKEKYDVSLSQKIKAAKNLKDVFKPLNRVKPKMFIEAINNIFPTPDQEKYKPGACVLTTLKGIAYLSEDKSENKKYLPKDSEQDQIVCGAIIYDYVRTSEYELDSLINILEAGIYKTFKNDLKFLAFIDEVTSVLRRIEYQDLDAAILDEFEHYDTVFKWLRANSLPSLEKVLEIVLDTISNKKIPVKHPFDQGILILNLVKKLGIRFITTRSNLEWALYGPQLKRIRNFMSKKTYLIYLTTVKDAIIKLYGSGDKYDVLSGHGGENIVALHETIQKLIEQKQKNKNKQ